jgi:hypothetical protein
MSFLIARLLVAADRVDSAADGTTVGRNLILEHGGAAVQLSIWGYEPTGPAAWFRHGVPCDPTPYANASVCASDGNTCVQRCCSEGSQVLDCKAQQPCGGWTAGAPFNPIQAQGKDCGWEDHSGSSVEWIGKENKTLHTVMESPWHFTSNRSAAPVIWEQWSTAHDDGYLNLTYHMAAAADYTGPAWGNTTQEIPAIFTARGVNHKWFWYNGSAPGAGAAVTTMPGTGAGYLQFPDRPLYPHATLKLGTVSEGWWGVCNEDETECVTVAGWSPLFAEAAMNPSGSNQSGHAYMTPIGLFSGLHAGMYWRWSLYIFPYKYDHMLKVNRTVRDVIVALKASE